MDQDQLTIASYPFLRAARDHLAASGIDFQELLEGDLFLTAREKGITRLEMAIEERRLPEVVVAGEADVLMELLSYILGRLMVASMNIDSLTRLYALTEATGYQKRLAGTEDREFLLELFQELGMEAELHASSTAEERDAGGGGELNEFRLPFNRYLDYTRRIKDPHWKLINQPMDRGQVLISRRRLVRLTRELLFDRFTGEIGSMKAPAEFPRELAAEMARLKERYLALREELRSDELGDVEIQNTPPCMISILTQVQNGENVAHAGRFALTAFLHMIGLSNKEILALNKSSPDFDEKIASYQVDHITGTISQTEYNPQSCKTMLSLGLCVNRNILCEKIIHPLGYYNAMNEGHKPPAVRRKRLLDFLEAYFPARRANELEAFFQGRKGQLRGHLEAAVNASPLFRMPPEPRPVAKEAGEQEVAGEQEGSGEGKEEGVQATGSVSAMVPGRWYRTRLKLKPFGKEEYGYIRTQKVRKGGAEHYILYAEFQGRGLQGSGVWLLPVMDMAVAVPLIVAGESEQLVSCCVIPFLDKPFLFIKALESDAQGSEDTEKEKQDG